MGDTADYTIRFARLIWLSAGLAAVLGNPTCVFGQSVVDRDRLIEAIADLDSARFVRREQATQDLIDGQRDSIDLLLNALPSASPETRRRGLFVLQRLALDDDEATETAARNALLQLAATDLVSLANRARQTLDYANRVREVKTLRRFEREGAVVTRRAINVNGEYYQIPYGIEIDERWSGDASALERLTWLTDIRVITLSGAHITDSVVGQLGTMAELVIVQLKDAVITDKSIVALCESPSLVELELKYCPITDESIDNLAKIRTLQLVKLYGTAISREGALRLAGMMPNAEIDYRAGGFLGVRCTTENQSCLITFVEGNSAAERAGMMAGDIIIEFDQNSVGSMEELIEMISKANVEQEVEVVYRRDDETYRRSVNLGRWD